eukprot:CAMPEP_0173090256 /NCGR_PEP_ID=MMETSP1102-20130122/26729_1 /TAXON_ID=49646 /ORGANISM="Geminigera sp., Strain Caron Lab Isolate" /LENGTH=110 /DNA_ID=CAMNT_0013974931 /DNA_START=216 /DNA_END=546 /DNA_ORIENTATION=+
MCLTASGEKKGGGRVSNRDDGVLVALQNEHRALLSSQRAAGHQTPRVPELHRAVLGARDEPGALRGKDDREDKVLMALEGVAALGTRWVALPSEVKSQSLSVLSSEPDAK